MPRKPRVLESGQVYHVFNRRTDCQLLFPSPNAFDGFLHLMEEGRERYEVRICAYCVMETHWHQALWVREGEGVTAVAKYLRWLSACHAIRFRYASQTRGFGHVYQDRYKSKVVHDDNHYLTLIRYIEANPLVDGLVERAEHWPWSSLAERLNRRRRILHHGPVPLLNDWPRVVNTRSALEETEDHPVADGDGGR
jgi:putative transposase